MSLTTHWRRANQRAKRRAIRAGISLVRRGCGHRNPNFITPVKELWHWDAQIRRIAKPAPSHSRRRPASRSCAPDAQPRHAAMPHRNQPLPLCRKRPSPARLRPIGPCAEHLAILTGQDHGTRVLGVPPMKLGQRNQQYHGSGNWLVRPVKSSQPRRVLAGIESIIPTKIVFCGCPSNTAAERDFSSRQVCGLASALHITNSNAGHARLQCRGCDLPRHDQLAYGVHAALLLNLSRCMDALYGSPRSARPRHTAMMRRVCRLSLLSRMDRKPPVS